MSKVKKTAALLGLAALGSSAYLYRAKSLIQKMAYIDHSYQNTKIEDLLPNEEVLGLYLARVEDDISWFKKSRFKKASITSFDGLELNAYQIENDAKRPYIIMVHGYNSDALSLLCAAHDLARRGYNLLMIDARGWGDSAGEICTFGFKESLDLVGWIDYLLKETVNDIGLYGVSMGASTVLKTLSYKLDPRVHFAIVDGPYSSLKGLLEKRAKTSLLMPALNHYVQELLGFDLTEMELVEAVKLNHTPTLFIHAKDDPIIPLSNSQDLFNMSEGLKELFIIDSNVHAYNFLYESYFKRIDEFLDHYLF